MTDSLAEIGVWFAIVVVFGVGIAILVEFDGWSRIVGIAMIIGAAIASVLAIRNT